jgi:CheY-like chemotaxis protein/anti-sigma regulatory factor (Ser/Thr protein kinase)
MNGMESRRLHLKPVPVELDKLMDEIAEQGALAAEEKGVKFIRDRNCVDRFVINGDPLRIKQLLLNLITNAVKYTEPGGEVRFIPTCAASDDGSRAELNAKVIDSGIGISKDFMDKVFVPFEQEDSTADGTGLGMSIVKSLVDMMGGEIEIESEKGKGTAVSVNISFEMSSVPASLSDDAGTDRSFMNGKRFLLCEDHPLNREIAVRMLAGYGAVVEEAADGEEGLAKFEGSAPGYYDCILMDIRMPKMNGLETVVAIRALDRPDAKTVPIISMTANTFDEDIEKSKAAGMNDHIGKPIDPVTFYSTLKKYI